MTPNVCGECGKIIGLDFKFLVIRPVSNKGTDDDIYVGCEECLQKRQDKGLNALNALLVKASE